MNDSPTPATDLQTLLGDDHPPRWWQRRAWWAASIALLLAAGGVWFWQAKAATNALPNYVTAPLSKGNLTLTVSANGTLQPTRSVNIGSELSGTVKRVLVDVNDRVKTGQVLVELDTSKLHDQVTPFARVAGRMHRRCRRRTQRRVKEAKATLARFEEVARLSGGKVPSATELDTARAAVARAEANLASAAANVAVARATLSTDETNLSKASIRSPIDGVVLSRSVDPGNAVAASLQAVTLFSVAENLTQLQLQASVDEADVGSVQGRTEGQLHRQRLPVAPLSGHDQPRRLRLDDHQQRRDLRGHAGCRQHRPEPAPGHDGGGHHRRHRAQRRAAGAQQRAALFAAVDGGDGRSRHARAAASCRR